MGAWRAREWKLDPDSGELKKCGDKGQVHMQQGIANADFLRVAGKDADGMLFPGSPVLVAEHGAGSRNLFGATVWDTYLLLDKAVPKALAKGQPGKVEFRTGLREALEQSKDVVGAQGVFSLSEKDHNGTDRRAQALVKVENGKWVLVTAAK